MCGSNYTWADAPMRKYTPFIRSGRIALKEAGCQDGRSDLRFFCNCDAKGLRHAMTSQMACEVANHGTGEK